MTSNSNLDRTLANDVFSANRAYVEAGREDFLKTYFEQTGKADEFAYMLNAFEKDNSTREQFA